MMHTTQTRLFVFAIALASLVSGSQAEEKRRLTQSDVRSKEDTSLNHIGLSYRAGFNVSVKFKKIGGFAPTDPNLRDTHGNTDPNYQSDQYDDGWNKIDSENDQHPENPNTTWFWGYYDNSQHKVVNGVDGIEMHSSSTSPTSIAARDSEPQNGFELTYNRELGRIKALHWGVEAAFGYQNLDARDNRTLSTPITRTNDFYGLPPDVVPQPAPYSSTFNGPNDNPATGTLLGNTPIRTVDFNVGTATTTGSRRLKADIFGFRAGPYLEFPLTKRVAISLSGGIAVAQVDGEFTVDNEIVTLSTVGKTSSTRSFRSSHSELLAGLYLSGNVSYELCRRARAFAGVQWQDLGTYKQNSGGKNSPGVEADFSQAIYLMVGVGVGF